MPSSTHFSVLRSVCALSLMCFLAACANTPPSPLPSISTASLEQEKLQYQKYAQGIYTPPGPSNDPWGPYIHEASKRFDIPTTWIRAVIQQESGGHIYDSKGHFITSFPGAMGLMQIMPPAYDDLRKQYNLGPDAYNPHDNIMAGTAYMRQMYEIYGSPGFLAAYNYGPGSIDRYLKQHKALPLETRRYISAIAPKISGVWPNHRSNNDLIVARHDPTAKTPPPLSKVSSDPESQAVSSAWAARGFKQPTSSEKAPASSLHTNNAPSDDTDETVSVHSIPLAHPAPRHTHMSDITAPARHNWGIQLGSYTTHPQAFSVTMHIRALIGLKSNQIITQILPIHLKNKKLYRARLTQLTHSQALSACRRLIHKAPCMPLSPSTNF